MKNRLLTPTDPMVASKSRNLPMKLRRTKSSKHLRMIFVTFRPSLLLNVTLFTIKSHQKKSDQSRSLSKAGKTSLKWIAKSRLVRDFIFYTFSQGNAKWKLHEEEIANVRAYSEKKLKFLVQHQQVLFVMQLRFSQQWLDQDTLETEINWTSAVRKVT